MNNPFDITKAVDFTDQQIVDYWVDISSNGGFKDLLKPTSLMPMIILGSKGSGKTHLMRYFSYELQKIKHKKNLKKGIDEDKFIGIYVRCSGLISERFNGKERTDEMWLNVYSYYWELWIAQISLNIILDLVSNNIIVLPNEKELVVEILNLFNKQPANVNEIKTLDDVKFLFSRLQKEVDYEVENCIFNDNKKFQVDILLSSSRITYGLPNIFTKYVPFFKDKIFLYLIDELENISESQQQLIQTLIREKNTACTFRIGARLYGIRTYQTLGSGEENREGSEFEQVVLDSFLRVNNKNYSKFMRKVCEHRLKINKIKLPQGQNIDDFVENFNWSTFSTKVKSKKISHSKSYFIRLREKLNSRINSKDIDSIISNLSADDLLVERTNLFIFYRAWNKMVKKGTVNEKSSLLKISVEIKNDTYNLLDKKTQREKVLEKYRSDLIDMIARETRENVPYYGFEEFVRMSSGTPRNLLNILKHSYKWTYFSEEKEAFIDENIIKIDAQAKGIKDTIEWFFEDNRIPSMLNGKLIDCIDRLGRFLRELKYSDTPPECSINIFGLNIEDLSIDARATFNFLEKYSYIVKSEEDRRDKNSNDKYRTYQINGTILPLWELSLYKRGIIILSPIEAESIFNLSLQDKFEDVLKKRKHRYNAPFIVDFANNHQTQLFFE